MAGVVTGVLSLKSQRLMGPRHTGMFVMFGAVLTFEGQGAMFHGARTFP